MNTILCPHCGKVGFHLWAGEGSCPGSVPQNPEIAKLLAATQEANHARDMLIACYQNLCREAAFALEDMKGPGWHRELIARLKAAAEP